MPLTKFILNFIKANWSSINGLNTLDGNKLWKIVASKKNVNFYKAKKK